MQKPHEKFPRMFYKLIRYAIEHEIGILPYSLFRTADEQLRLYRSQKSTKDGYTNKSKHQEGRAVDLVILDGQIPHWSDDERYEKLGKYWEFLGGTWGGRWKDPHDIYHFEV